MKRGWGSLCARCRGNLLASARWIARCSRGCQESSSAGDQAPHSGALVYDYGVPCGRITSAGWAPYVQQQVAMALVNRSFLEEKEHDFAVESGTERLACHMEKLPFYKTIQRY